MNITRRIISMTLLFSFFLSLLYVPSISAEKYYADVDVSVDDNGFVTITGKTNHPDLLIENTEKYTTKKQSLWLLNITKEENFSDFIYTLTLPKGASITGIKTSGSIFIEAKSDNIIIKGVGKNESLSLMVQYKINPSSLDWNILFILIGIIIVLVITIIIVKYQNKRKKSEVTDKDIERNEDYNFKGLTSRQKQIVKLLIDFNRPLTQAEIQKELNIPKAAVSRNIHSLELKEIIEIEKIGMSNLIRLKKR